MSKKIVSVVYNETLNVDSLKGLSLWNILTMISRDRTFRRYLCSGWQKKKNTVSIKCDQSAMGADSLTYSTKACHWASTCMQVLAEWLRQTSQGYKMCCSWSKGQGFEPHWIKLEVRSTSNLVVLVPKITRDDLLWEPIHSGSPQMRFTVPGHASTHVHVAYVLKFKNHNWTKKFFAVFSDFL